jgi:hypothetical protein
MLALGPEVCVTAAACTWRQCIQQYLMSYKASCQLHPLPGFAWCCKDSPLTTITTIFAMMLQAYSPR